MPTKKKTTKRKRGPAPKINKIDMDEVVRIAEIGLTDNQIAKALGITKQTLNNYKKKYPEFFDSLKKGKKIADDKVVVSLYRRALGYSHPDIHVSTFQGQVTVTPIMKHYPPDVAAITLWLKNRLPDEWRDKKEIEGVLRLEDVIAELDGE